jgi:hypothetical protein
MSMKNSGQIIGNQTHDPPVCSTVPQPTACLRNDWMIANNETEKMWEVVGMLKVDT